MNCPRCNSEVTEGQAFCPNCGAPLPQEAPAAQAGYGQYPAQPQSAAEQGQQQYPPQTQPMTPQQAAPLPYQGQGQAFYPAVPAAPLAPQAAKKSKRTRNIILGAVGGVLVVVLAVVGILTFMEASRANDYSQAVGLMDNGSYQEALDKFDGLGDYQDSALMAFYCQQYLDFDQAQSLMFDAGDYQGALDILSRLAATGGSPLDPDLIAYLASSCRDNINYEAGVERLDAKDYAGALGYFRPLSPKDFPDLPDKIDACNYALADQLLAAGDRYDAYVAFEKLGDYSDAAARAQSCIVPITGSYEAYHDPGFVSSSCDLTIVSHAADETNFVKLYCGDTLVSSVFILPGASVKISVPPNTYRIKAASGVNWFGDVDLFGDDGDYYTMTFDDAGTETMDFQPNYAYTLDLLVPEGGNVGSRGEDREGF